MDADAKSPVTCARCERLPDVAPGAGYLFLWPPVGHTGAKIADVARLYGLDVRARAGGGYFSIDLTAGPPAGFAEALGATVTSLEARDTRVLFHDETGDLSLNSIGKVCTLGQWSAAEDARWLVDILAGERLISHFQPIVHAADPSRVFAQECLMRAEGPDGVLIFPDSLLRAARDVDLLFQLDRQARISAVRNAAQKNICDGLFINFAPTALYDPASCLRTTLEAVDSCRLDRASVVFEVIETEHIADTTHLRNVLDFYRAEGFRIALDDLGAGYASLNLLSILRPDFVKIDRALVTGVHADPFKAVIVQRLAQIAQDLGIGVIAEGVEQRDEFDWLRDRGIDYVQGYLFARPNADPLSRIDWPPAG